MRDLDGVSDLMVKFERASVIEHLGTVDYPENAGKHYPVTLRVTGHILGITFAGTATINVLS